MPRVSRFTPLDEIPVAVLDTETTGLDVSSCRLVQISAVRVAGGQVLERPQFDRLVNPGVPIPPQATRLHGITDAMVAGAPPFAEVWPLFEQFADGAVLVGQSIGFDLAVLLRETQLLGAPWRRPQFLDTKRLAASLDAQARERDLDAIAAWLGVPIANRHQALGDALVTAEIFVRLLPRLAAAGIRTLGDAEARSNAQTRLRAREATQGWYDATSMRPLDPYESGRDAPAFAARLDSVAYRHRVEHVMSRSVVIVPPSTRLGDAVRRMAADHLHVLLAGDPVSGRIDGIVTPRDVLAALARDDAAGLERRIETMMSAPVATMPRDAFLYRAIARMQRLGVGQLPIEDEAHRVVGMLSLRELLADEAGAAVQLGDQLSTAPTPRALAAGRAELPALARRLAGDDVPAAEVTAVLAAELRELLARAAALAEARMETEGAGRPPVPYALLALGRVGRGEALLDTELEHAIVFASGAPQSFEARWFDTFAAHLDDVLRAARVAAPPSPAIAAAPLWRRSLDGWRDELHHWAAAPAASAVPAAAFFDFRFAYGDDELAEDLRTVAFDVAGRAPELTRALAPASPVPPPSGNPVDLAAAGLAPIEAVARALAVATRGRSLATGERLAEACPQTGLSRQSADELTELHERLLHLLLAHQQQDLAAARSPSGLVDRGGLTAEVRAEIDAALQRTARLRSIVRVALALV